MHLESVRRRSVAKASFHTFAKILPFAVGTSAPMPHPVTLRIAPTSPKRLPCIRSALGYALHHRASAFWARRRYSCRLPHCLRGMDALDQFRERLAINELQRLALGKPV
jgi:hypothetical protein